MAFFLAFFARSAWYGDFGASYWEKGKLKTQAWYDAVGGSPRNLFFH